MGPAPDQLVEVRALARGYCVVVLMHYTTIAVPLYTQVYTAVSTKVVPQQYKSARDNADWY